MVILNTISQDSIILWHFPHKKSLICAHDVQTCVIDKPQRKSNVTTAQAADNRGMEVVQWLMEDIKEHIGPNQFGSLKDVSTTVCLLDMLHSWLSALESPGRYLKVCFLDFSKAFDHIDHNILVCKLLEMGARSKWIVKWICSFLSQRRQAVKLDGLLSEWAPVHAGVIQGTKLGPVLFLVMVNDLACRSSYWKCVDDITISEVVPHGSPSTIQDGLDSITAWAEENCLNLNPKKCKEMRLSFLAKGLDVLQLTVNDTYLEKVSVHKVWQSFRTAPYFIMHTVLC